MTALAGGDETDGDDMNFASARRFLRARRTPASGASRLIIPTPLRSDEIARRALKPFGKADGDKRPVRVRIVRAVADGGQPEAPYSKLLL